MRCSSNLSLSILLALLLPFSISYAQQLPDNPGRDLDNYLGHFQRTCDFLDRLQEHNPDDEEYGGMHEGEVGRLWDIVETDNTQEAIRVWCEYALYFDDPESYRENIDQAWIYTDNFPAWDEAEGREEALYYAIHNCGWGLVAEMRFRQAYDDSRRDYGIRCADFIVSDTPEIDPRQQDRLMPLVVSWAAGALYDYGVFEDNAEYRERAVEIANQVKAWIDHHPPRLNSNEMWAMSGGTAMWGVLTALGQADSANTADWAQDILENMDIFAGDGQWNNSWNIWYTHAWITAHQLTGVQEYQENAISILDSLVAQDYDFDGGIPATIGDDLDQDQSWVSAYTCWMGISKLWNVLPEVDINVRSLRYPDASRPWSVNDTLTLGFSIENAGSMEQITAPLTLSYNILGEVTQDEEFQIAGWQPIVVEFSDPIVIEVPGPYEFTCYSSHEDDNNQENDSLRFELEILPVGTVNLQAQSNLQEPVVCEFVFSNLDIGTQHRIVTSDQDGTAELSLMVGSYSVEIIPEFPYPRDFIDNYEVTDEQNEAINRFFSQPPVLLIDRDTDSTHYTYFTETFEQFEIPFYRWQSEDQGVIVNRTDNFDLVVYFTGNRSENTIPEADQNELRRCQQESDTDIFVTGQYIADEFAGTAFLEEVLHSIHLANEIRNPYVFGVDGDEVFDGMSMLLIGNRGANNQDARSGIRAANIGINAGHYQDRPDTSGIVRWENDNGTRGVFFGFGFEAISGQVGNSREEVMNVILDWTVEWNDVDPRITSPLPCTDKLTCNVYPSVTNGMVNFDLSSRLDFPVDLSIYNTNGRLIQTINTYSNAYVTWHCNLKGTIPTGKYLFMINHEQRGTIHSGDFILLK